MNMANFHEIVELGKGARKEAGSNDTIDNMW